MEQTENSQLFLDTSGNWGHRANHCTQNWTGVKTDTENHSLLEQKPKSRSLLLLEPVMWQKNLNVIDELLKSQNGQLLESLKLQGFPDLSMCLMKGILIKFKFFKCEFSIEISYLTKKDPTYFLVITLMVFLWEGE